MAATGPSTVAAILVAAGSGERLGADVPKAFVPIGGRTLLEHAVERFLAHPRVGVVVVAVPSGWTETGEQLLPGAVVIAGGPTRQGSVDLALRRLGEHHERVLVHDVARPFVPPEVIDRVIDALQGGSVAVVPVRPVTDTVRRYDAVSGTLGELVDRAGLAAMQTPQGFRTETLIRAHRSDAAGAATDDAALVEAIGGRVHAVRGDALAFKITVALDLEIAEMVAARG